MGGRELTIFCVDVSPSMAELRTVDDFTTGTIRSASNLDFGLEYVRHQVTNMLLAGLKTVHCAIVLFGSDRTKNSLADKGYEFIWEYVSPAQPSAIMLSHIDAIKAHLTSSEEQFKGDLLSAIILCNHLMGETLGSKKWTRKLVLVTDAQTETDWNGWKDQRNKMKIDDVKLTVVGLDFDDPDVGYIQPNKSEIKAANEKKLHGLCEGLANGSNCSTALLAVMNAQSPQPRVVGSNPTGLTLTLGYPDLERAEEHGYRATETLMIKCQLQKCTTLVRPMACKKMSKLGVAVELERRRRDLEPGQSSKALERHRPVHDDPDAPTGLLQINRRHVYVSKSADHGPSAQAAGRDDDSDDPDVKESSDDEPGPLEYREADPARVQKAYKYGASRVLLDKEDELAIRQSFSTSLQIRGFIHADAIPRHHLMNNVYYLSPSNQDGRSQITFSAVVRAMSDGNRVALARYVSKSVTAEPKMVVLIPVIEPSIRYFLFVQVPFAEDLREYLFPPLASVKSLPGRRMNAQHVPTQEMQEAMDEYVDRMDLVAEAEEGAEAGTPGPWLDIEHTCSPAVHHMKNCVLYRLCHPDSEALPAVHPALAKCLAPPAHVTQRAAASLARIVALFAVKSAPVPAKKARNQATYAPLKGPAPAADDHIDLDDILGDDDADEPKPDAKPDVGLP